MITDQSKMVAEDNVAIVKQFFYYYEKNDVEGLRDIFHPDVIWSVPGHHPLAGTKRGIEEVLAYYQLLNKANFKAEIIIVEANEHHVIDCHRGWASIDGHEIDMNWTLLYEVKDGKILSMQTFPEDQHKMDQFFWNVYKLKKIPDRME